MHALPCIFGHLSRSPGKLPTQPDWANCCKASFPTSFAWFGRSSGIQGGPKDGARRPRRPKRLRRCYHLLPQLSPSLGILGQAYRFSAHASPRTLSGGPPEAPWRPPGGRNHRNGAPRLPGLVCQTELAPMQYCCSKSRLRKSCFFCPPNKDYEVSDRAPGSRQPQRGSGLLPPLSI